MELLITEDLYNPQDKMDQDVLLRVCNPKVTLELAKSEDHATVDLANYLNIIYMYYHIFMDSPDRKDYEIVFDNLAVKVEAFEYIMSYFVAWAEKREKNSFVTSQVYNQIKTTYVSFFAVVNMHLPTKFSTVSTLVVENHFSTIRSKCYYPSLLEYIQTQGMANLYARNMRSCNLLFNMKIKEISKAYGNATVIENDLDLIKLSRKPTRKDANLAENNTGRSPELHLLLEKHKTKRSLTIRQKSTFTNSLETHRDIYSCALIPKNYPKDKLDNLGKFSLGMCTKSYVESSRTQFSKHLMTAHLVTPQNTELLIKFLENNFQMSSYIEKQNVLDEIDNKILKRVSKSLGNSIVVFVDVEHSGFGKPQEILEIGNLSSIYH